MYLLQTVYWLVYALCWCTHFLWACTGHSCCIVWREQALISLVPWASASGRRHTSPHWDHQNPSWASHRTIKWHKHINRHTQMHADTHTYTHSRFWIWTWCNLKVRSYCLLKTFSEGYEDRWRERNIVLVTSLHVFELFYELRFLHTKHSFAHVLL